MSEYKPLFELIWEIILGAIMVLLYIATVVILAIYNQSVGETICCAILSLIVPIKGVGTIYSAISVLKEQTQNNSDKEIDNKLKGER